MGNSRKKVTEKVKGAAVFFQQENPISENEIAIESNNESTSQIAYRGAPVDQTLEDMYKCPNGLNLITTCYSQECVEQAMGNLANNFSSGETISIYHNGLGGVKVCSNVK